MKTKSNLPAFLLRKMIIGLVIIFLATLMVSILMHSASHQPREREQMSYFEWVQGLLALDFFSREFFVKTFRTLILTLCSLAVSLVLALPLGILSARKRDSRSLRFLTGLTDLVCSTPVFVTGYLLILVGIKLFEQNFAVVGSERSSLALPIMFLTLGLSNGTVSEITRHAREETVRISEQRYITAVVARGVNFKRHFAKSLLIPLLNIVSSRMVYLLSGAVVVEHVFTWEGIGKWSWDSALAGDYPVVMSITFIMVLFVLLVRLSNNLVASHVDLRRR
jgi:peptide/nickel transport system permease protein